MTARLLIVSHTVVVVVVTGFMFAVYWKYFNVLLSVLMASMLFWPKQQKFYFSDRS